MTLLIDIGNTRLKWAAGPRADWKPRSRPWPAADAAAALTEIWGELDVPDAVAVSNVTGVEVERVLTRWCLARWHVEPWFLRPSGAACGVVNGYRQPGQLGVDRWAAMIGARREYTGALAVVDCGTALTVDGVDPDGRHVGGAILPGFRLAGDSLRDGTHGVVEVEAPQAGALGRSTGECVAAGAELGLAGAVHRLVEEVARVSDAEVLTVITGGDAQRLAVHMQGPIRVQPDLVLIGLHQAFGAAS